MELIEVPPSDRLADLLKKFKASWGVVEHVLIERLDTTSPPSRLEEFHRVAALFTIQTIYKRHPHWERGAKIEPDKLQGGPMRLSEFFAPAEIEVNTQNLIANPYITEEYAELLRQHVKDGRTMGAFTPSYAKVFKDPPYSLQITPEELKVLFHGINHHLFGYDRSVITIYRWSTEWANWFDRGHEWWGSYLWTVHRADTDQIIGIAASETD